MTTYVLLNDSEKDIVNTFNQGSQYLAIICSMPFGDCITQDTLDMQGYEALVVPLAHAVRVVVDDNGNVISGIVPQEVPLWCLRTVIKLMGLFDQVNLAIESMPTNTPEEVQQKTAAWEGWEYGNTVARDSYTTLFVQSVLGLSDAQVDDIFVNADKVDA